MLTEMPDDGGDDDGSPALVLSRTVDGHAMAFGLDRSGTVTSIAVGTDTIPYEFCG